MAAGQYEPEGFTAISRGLSAAIPPVAMENSGAPGALRDPGLMATTPPGNAVTDFSTTKTGLDGELGDIEKARLPL